MGYRRHRSMCAPRSLLRSERTCGIVGTRPNPTASESNGVHICALAPCGREGQRKKQQARLGEGCSSSEALLAKRPLTQFLPLNHRAALSRKGRGRNNGHRVCIHIHISRFQTAHLLPAARFLRPGFATLASLTRIEGWAERRETFGCVRGTRGTRRPASKTRVNALMTRRARRLARRLASHDPGRSPLGAPPWRFFTRGRASLTGICAGSVTASDLAARS